MADLDLKHKINVPFAEKGSKINIPDISQSGTVNMTDGFGSKYDTPITEGGEYIYREEMNEILYKVYAAVKELQDLAVTAGFPVDMTKALNVLSLANGGTGANNVTQARSNLGLGSLATKDVITETDIQDNTITNDKILGVDASKISGLATVAKTGSYNDLLNKPNHAPMPKSASGVGQVKSIIGQATSPITYTLPADGTYFYAINVTRFPDATYHAVGYKAGIAAGGTKIFDASLNVQTFGGFIWRIQ